jgi:hypothetical protein
MKVEGVARNRILTLIFLLHSHAVSHFEIMFDFQNLEVYKKAKAFRKYCKQIMKLN